MFVFILAVLTIAVDVLLVYASGHQIFTNGPVLFTGIVVGITVCTLMLTPSMVVQAYFNARCQHTKG